MKLGEALSLRARQAQKLNELRGRIKTSARSQEGTEPPENPDDLLDEYVELSNEHRDLVKQIAATNAETEVEGFTILDLLQDREAIGRERNVYLLAANAASGGESDGYRYMKSELKYVTTLDIAALRTVEDQASEEIRVLDAKIQAANWATDLI